MLSSIHQMMPVQKSSRIKTQIGFSDSRYQLKLARNEKEIDEALSLRFKVFNLELNQGLMSSFHTLRDEDVFDKQYHHLLVTEKSTHKLIGTYRIQTFEMARSGKGFYSETEFNIKELGRSVLARSVELGRACILKDHRNSRVLFLLWKGIGQYMMMTQKCYLFGCCSIGSQNPVDGIRLMDLMGKMGVVSANSLILPKPGFECCQLIQSDTENKQTSLPPLMGTYFRFGAKVVSYPAIDRKFKTIDYLLLLDTHKLNDEAKNLFF